jgi:adenylate kinase family enzyme
MIFGRPGSGKSTFAVALHQTTAIPLHHLDFYFYVDNWVERNYEEFLIIQQSFIDQQQWIIDGNATKSLEMRYKRATLCLYFNRPRWLCYWRIIKRIFFKNPAIKDRALNCKETISWKLLKYMWNFEDRVTEPIKKLQSFYPHVKFIEIRTQQDLKKLTNKLMR